MLEQDYNGFVIPALSFLMYWKPHWTRSWIRCSFSAQLTSSELILIQVAALPMLSQLQGKWTMRAILVGCTPRNAASVGGMVAHPCQSHRQSCANSASDESGCLEISRRMVLSVPALSSLPFPAFAEGSSLKSPVNITLDAAPDQSKYDPSDPDLRASGKIFQDALNAQSVEEEERLWTKIIQGYGGIDKNWGPDIVGRALGNRGNARSRMGRLSEALEDYNKAIDLCPWAVDPVLNRGVVYESLDRFEEALDDYKAILAVDDKDPAAWNNLGNTYLAMGDYKAAEDNYGHAVALSPDFAFASANRSIALFQLGKEREAVRNFRGLLRRYPEFPDVRAALVAGLWKLGMEEEAETEWLKVDDPRYKDRNWLEAERRWPPSLVDSLDDFIKIRDPNRRS